MANIEAIIGTLSLSEVEDIHPPPPTPHPPGTNAMPQPKILAIVAKLQQIGFYGGISGIAESEDVPKAWVIEVNQARKDRIKELTGGP